MQTEQFDDEFRKKLLDINLTANENEVERIYNYISSNGSSVSRFPLTKVILYGLVATALIGSLTFNYIQNITNKELFSSIDSLNTRLSSVNDKPQTVIVRVDTVYVNKFSEKIILPEISQKPHYTEKVGTGPSGQFDINPETVESVNDFMIKKSDSTGIASNKTIDGSDENIIQNDVYNNRTKGIESTDPIFRKQLITDDMNKNESIDKTPPRFKDNSSKTVLTKKSVFNFDENASKNEIQIKESRTWLLSELRKIVHLKPILVNLKFPALKKPEKIIPVKDKPHYYSQSIKSVLSKMNYYVGGSFDVGNSRVGGSLLGEIKIDPKWSFQTGARWSQITGDTYYTAEQFSQETGQDFRALYAPYVSQNADLLNIEQNYHLVQIPLTVAYHYQILPDWALRAALGTDISIYSQKHFQFDYRENSQSFDQGDYDTQLAVKPFNDLSISLGLERRWNKFLFRASPYISPQFRRTEYAKEYLSWGARAQVLYKLK